MSEIAGMAETAVRLCTVVDVPTTVEEARKVIENHDPGAYWTIEDALGEFRVNAVPALMVASEPGELHGAAEFVLDHLYQALIPLLKSLRSMEAYNAARQMLESTQPADRPAWVRPKGV